VSAKSLSIAHFLEISQIIKLKSFIMSYEYLISDLKSQKSIGTDKGLAKIGDGIVNTTYSIAKSIYLSQKSTNKIYRTGLKVSKKILSKALINANMKHFAKNRADAHDMADTVEALIAFVFLNNNMGLKDLISFLSENFSGEMQNRVQEIESATNAFTNLLLFIKKYLPVD